jgi:hypothetical protein
VLAEGAVPPGPVEALGVNLDPRGAGLVVDEEHDDMPEDAAQANAV